MYKFTESTLKILKQAGWESDRKVDITQQEKMLQKHGYEIFPVVKQFLSNFAEMKIKLPKITFDFCISNVVKRRFPEMIFEVSNEFGVPLCPIGGDEPFVDFLMDQVVHIYLWDEYNLYLVGNNVEEAIEALCHTPSPRISKFKLVL